MNPRPWLRLGLLASVLGACSVAPAQDTNAPAPGAPRGTLGVNAAVGDPPPRSARPSSTPPATAPAASVTDALAVPPLPVPGAVAAPPAAPAPAASTAPPLAPRSLVGSLQPMVLFGVVSLLPVGVLLVSAFVRISVVLSLLRQALGSPQVPGNQVMMGLSLMLTALVMWPAGERVYQHAIVPYNEGTLGPAEAWQAGSAPIKAFMIEQIVRARHEHYLVALGAHVARSPGEPEPTTCEQFPLRVIAPAFLLSELTTALFLGFAVYLPFLVVDLVVSAVLAAMGLFMLPPALVAMPLKLILFVLADGWILTADMLLRSFGTPAGSV